MQNKFDMIHQDAHVAVFQCEDCAAKLRFTPSATIETIETEQAAHRCQPEFIGQILTDDRPTESKSERC